MSSIKDWENLFKRMYSDFCCSYNSYYNFYSKKLDESVACINEKVSAKLVEAHKECLDVLYLGMIKNLGKEEACRIKKESTKEDLFEYITERIGKSHLVGILGISEEFVLKIFNLESAMAHSSVRRRRGLGYKLSCIKDLLTVMEKFPSLKKRDYYSFIENSRVSLCSDEDCSLVNFAMSNADNDNMSEIVKECLNSW